MVFTRGDIKCVALKRRKRNMREDVKRTQELEESRQLPRGGEEKKSKKLRDRKGTRSC